ncbi:MAG: metallophosphoesterase [Candidatus Absconditabacterales bacterium]
MKNFTKMVGGCAIASFLILLSGCNFTTIHPFSNGGHERNMLVVMSDIHLGANSSYAEIKANLIPLQNILQQIEASPNVKELVLNGDIFDEWFVPANVDTYQGKDQADFMQRIAATNSGVINILNAVIQDKKIIVTYIPGNHDLTITEKNIDSILPGIHQARDKQQGLGTYIPTDYPKTAIEHGHRYDFFCAPDPISNQDIAPGTILPPGYFYTRIAVLHVIQNPITTGDIPPNITQNISGDTNQKVAFLYWNIWNRALNTYPIANKFDEKIIVTNLDGFTGNYAINDILPYQTISDGTISMKLYSGIQDTWDQRQLLNNVAIHTPVMQAITNAGNGRALDDEAKNQYFLNPASDKRIIVFGHSHQPKIITSQNTSGEKSIYANDGTWIDHNPLGSGRTFIVITPQDTNPSSQTFVRLYNFENDVITEMAEEYLHY